MRFTSRSKIALSLSAVLILGGCAYSIDKQYQYVTFETPGATGAKCHVYVDGIHYPVNTPAEISIPRSKTEMKVDCLAPGNRRKLAMIPPRRSPIFWANGLNAFAGVPWDLASGAAYEYPDIIQISFVGMKASVYDPPKHDAYDVKRDVAVDLEEFKPRREPLNTDRYIQHQPIKKRERAVEVVEEETPAYLSPAQMSPAPQPIVKESIFEYDPSLENVTQSGMDRDFSQFND